MAAELEPGAQPTIRISSHLFDHPSKTTDFYCDVLDLFHEWGFGVCIGGDIDPANSNDCGLLMRFGKDKVEEAMIQLDMAHRHGLRIPEVYTYEQLPTLPKPVVAKVPDNHGGRNKYLLNEQNWSNFLALTSFPQSDIVAMRTFPQSFSEALVALRKKQLGNGLLETGGLDTDAMLRDWLLQEYIQPHDYPTSVRVVADMYGTVHYAVLLYSTQSVDGQKVPDLENAPLNPFQVRHPYDHFRNPQSPFYLNSAKITANQAQGGRAIYLFGQKVTGVEGDILKANGIDPDQALLPDSIIRACSALGVEGRQLYPFIGIDLIEGKVFTEMNRGPGIPPEELGMPRNATNFETQLEMMHVVHSHLSLCEYLRQQGRYEQSVFGQIAP